MSGRDLTGLSEKQLQDAALSTNVFARVAPEHKIQLVEALQAQRHIVAMTGDGVNDAPAIKRADIGIAMGITGTAVSKEAAKVVLMDDNFASIVKAIREGRAVYRNIRKFLLYIFNSNTPEAVPSAAFRTMPAPLQSAPTTADFSATTPPALSRSCKARSSTM